MSSTSGTAMTHMFNILLCFCKFLRLWSFVVVVFVFNLLLSLFRLGNFYCLIFQVHWIFPLSFSFYYWAHKMSLLVWSSILLYVFYFFEEAYFFFSLKIYFFICCKHVCNYVIFIMVALKFWSDNSSTFATLGLVSVDCIFSFELRFFWFLLSQMILLIFWVLCFETLYLS